VFTKADFIQAAKDYLEWTDDAGNKDDSSRGTTANYSFSKMLKNENIVEVA
jgi:hypothetical protein